MNNINGEVKLREIFKKHYLLFIIAAAGLIVAYICGMNDFPEFIRAIKGADFTGIWMEFFIGILILATVIIVVLSYFTAAKNLKKACELRYSDPDLMTLQKFDRYQITGYYLLKAKVYKLIDYTSVDSEGMIKSVILDPNTDPELRKKYCLQDRQLCSVVKYVEEYYREHDGYLSPEKIIRELNSDIPIKSHGGKFAERIVKRISVYLKSILFSSVFVIYFIGFLKLFMGISNGKPITNLVFTMIGSIFFFVFMILFPLGFSYHARNGRFINKIVQYKLKNINALSSNEERIIRAYALNKSKSGFDMGDENDFAAVIFAGVSVLQTAAARASSGNNAGCSSCSSCGGGCGGCGGGCGGCGGGCGGCGD